jgi:hypothetical protein
MKNNACLYACIVYLAVITTAIGYGLYKWILWFSADPFNRLVITIELIIAFFCLMLFLVHFLTRKDNIE